MNNSVYFGVNENLEVYILNDEIRIFDFKKNKFIFQIKLSNNQWVEKLFKLSYEVYTIREALLKLDEQYREAAEKFIMDLKDKVFWITEDKAVIKEISRQRNMKPLLNDSRYVHNFKKGKPVFESEIYNQIKNSNVVIIGAGFISQCLIEELYNLGVNDFTILDSKQGYYGQDFHEYIEKNDNCDYQFKVKLLEDRIRESLSDGLQIRSYVKDNYSSIEEIFSYNSFLVVTEEYCTENFINMISEICEKRGIKWTYVYAKDNNIHINPIILPDEFSIKELVPYDSFNKDFQNNKVIGSLSNWKKEHEMISLGQARFVASLLSINIIKSLNKITEDLLEPVNQLLYKKIIVNMISLTTEEVRYFKGLSYSY